MTLKQKIERAELDELAAIAVFASLSLLLTVCAVALVIHGIFG